MSTGNLGDYKALDGEIYEGRLFFGPGYRIYFAKDGETILLLLLGGEKETQRKDIEKAGEYHRDYLRRKDGSH